MTDMEARDLAEKRWGRLQREELLSLEEYARSRDEFRQRIMAHKANRRLKLGEHAMLIFEDRLTMQYQIQEMLRVERIFTEDGIREELDSYNPLIPDGGNWKATLMLEYSDEKERHEALRRLLNVENCVWLQIGAGKRISPICDEDLDRETEDKTSSVHFLRFELNADAIAELRDGAELAAGVDHPEYNVEVLPVPENVRASLLADLA
jgi:hypothetical protein